MALPPLPLNPLTSIAYNVNFGDTHEWDLEVYPEPEFHRLHYIRKCAVCKIQQKIIFDDHALLIPPMTMERLIKVFNQTQTQLLPNCTVFGNKVTVFGNKVTVFDDKGQSGKSGEFASPMPVLSKILPGLNVKVLYPCPCYSESPNWLVSEIIIHLNDTHQWTRERIADWLETLDVDLTFPTPQE